MTEKILSGVYAKVADPAQTFEGVVATLRRARISEQIARLTREIEQAQRRGDAARSQQLLQEQWSLRKQVD